MQMQSWNAAKKLIQPAKARPPSGLRATLTRRKDLLMAIGVIVLAGLVPPLLHGALPHQNLLPFVASARAFVREYEWEEFERFYKGRNVKAVGTRIAFVGVDDAAYSHFEIKEPMPRKYLAGLISTLCQNSHPQAIGIDVLLDAPSPPGHEFEDDMLEEALELAHARHVPVVLACNPEPASGELPIFPLDRFARHAEVGHALLQRDENSPLGQVRQAEWFYPYQDRRLPAMSVLLAARAQGISPAGTEAWLRDTLRPRGDFASYLYFTGGFKNHPFPSDDVAPQNPVLPQIFDNKVVLVGATASMRGDVVNTPFADPNYPAGLPGVLVHGFALTTLLGPGIVVPPLWLESLMSMLLGGLFLWLLYRVGTTRTFILSLLALLVLWIGTLVLCAFTGILLNLVPALAAVFVCGLLWWYRRKRYLNACFESFLTRPVMKGIGGTNDLRDFRSTTATGSILFCDLIGYSKACRDMTPDEAIRLVNYYLSPVADVVKAHGGILDKYLGDGCFAFFGVPLPGEKPISPVQAAFNAADAALRIQEAMDALREGAAVQDLPVLTLSIGIHTGPLTAGLVGPLGRKQFTVIGDSVNDACRVESIGHQPDVTPPFTTRIQISHVTAQLLDGIADLEPKNYTPTEKYSAPIYELRQLAAVMKA